MEQQKFPRLRDRSFSYFLLLNMIILILIIVSFLVVNDYLQTKENFEHEEGLLQIQTEQNIRQAMRLEEYTWDVYDVTLNDRMKADLEIVLREYERAGNNPEKMNLNLLKEDLGNDTDIYIIDEYGIIVRTTYPEEQGLDFKKIPYFYEYLTKIRMSDGFFPDSIVREMLGSGKFRKYAYMPTPDHSYIIELGLATPEFENLTKKLDERANIQNIVSVNPYVEQFRIFNSMGRNIEDNSLPEEPVRGYLSTVLKNRQNLDVPDPDHRRITRYLFVDVNPGKTGSDMSRIVEVTYDTGKIQETFDHLLLSHILIAAAVICAGCLIAFFLSRRMNQPISDIVRDVDIIARGDLDHRIGEPQSREFAVLAGSINRMVDSLKDALQKVREGEQVQQEMIDQLPVAVFFKRVSDGKYVFWNRTCETLFKRSTKDVIGKTDKELFPAELVETIEREDRAIIESGTSLQNKMISGQSAEGRVIHMIIVPIADPEGRMQYLLGISEDVTQENINIKMDLLFSITRRDILEQLSVLVQSLERAQLLSSHESVQTFFDRTTVSVEAIRNQIAFMRTLQELGILTPKWHPVKQEFEDAAGLLPTKTVVVSSDIADLEIYADPLLPRVFYNLIDNSLRHGGAKLAWIRLSAKREGDGLLLIYEDNGNGIPEQEKEDIFSFGYGTGKGVGLFLAREILMFTGITIHETGISGKGIRLEIFIPKDRFRLPG